jgi:hypothetical protein
MASPPAIPVLFSLSLRETSAGMREVEQRREQLPRAGVREMLPLPSFRRKPESRAVNGVACGDTLNC